MNRQQELNRLLSQEPKNEGRAILLSILVIMVAPWLMLWVILNGDIIDAFCRNHPIEIGVSLIVFGCIGSVMFARYLHNHWFI